MGLISWTLQSGSEQYGITQGHVTLCIGIRTRHVHRVRVHCIMQGYHGQRALQVVQGTRHWCTICYAGDR
jgi:hypothetical protein